MRAHQALAELKGIAATIPNESILINTLALQEAKDSSAIENIITTQDKLFRSDVASRNFVTVAAKEVHFYASALRHGGEFLPECRAVGFIYYTLPCAMRSDGLTWRFFEFLADEW